MNRLVFVALMLSISTADAKSPQYWTRRASNAKTELAEKLYLAEASRVAVSRKHIVANAKKKAEGRADRIERRKKATTPPTKQEALSFLAALAWASRPASRSRRVYVRPYTRRDGTHVRGHYRSR